MPQLLLAFALMIGSTSVVQGHSALLVTKILECGPERIRVSVGSEDGRVSETRAYEMRRGHLNRVSIVDDVTGDNGEAVLESLSPGYVADEPADHAYDSITAFAASNPDIDSDWTQANLLCMRSPAPGSPPAYPAPVRYQWR